MRAVAKKLINPSTLHKSTLFNSTHVCEFFLFQPGAVKQISREVNVPILFWNFKGTLNDSKKRQNKWNAECFYVMEIAKESWPTYQY